MAAASAERPAVVVRDLSLTFPGRGRGADVPVLTRIDLEVARGEFVCIVGPSGCGKSTLLNVVAGFLRPSRGEVLVEGEPVQGPDPRRIFVFQENGVFPWLTVEHNIGFGLSRRSADERRRLIAHYVEMVGLGGFEQAYPRQLSGGMRQRVEIARALAASPDVLYMDEPFGALDFLTRMKMRADLIRIWQAERKTVLFVTHDIEEAVQLADRVIVMTPRPAEVQEVLAVDLPRPRDLDSPAYLATRDHILSAMGMRAHLGGADEAPPPRAQPGPRPSLDADVIVLGGGPAGAIVGAYLAQAGVNHLILDKAVHPRPHVGESLLCSTTRVFQEIGFVPEIERHGFVRKHGAVWTHFAAEREVRLSFRPIPRLGIEQSWSWHVDRSRFDDLLLRHAASLGSRVAEGTSAVRVELDRQGRACGVRVQGRDGAKAEVLGCRLVVDATGRSTLLGTQLRLKRTDPELHQFAVHGWFEGVERGPAETGDDLHVHVLPGARAWAWQIPISRSVTSVGVVTAGADFVKAGEPASAFFTRQIAGNPVLARRMAAAQPLQALTREGNYSYAMERIAGDGWLLVGDAARFIDPLFSSGVSVAAESARAAARAIIAALSGGDTGPQTFAGYERAIQDGADHWRTFILLYYRLPPLFLSLLAREGAREELRELLQGEVFERDPSPILGRIRGEIAAVQADATHPWRAELAPLG